MNYTLILANSADLDDMPHLQYLAWVYSVVNIFILILLNADISSLLNNEDPDQLASYEAS